MPIPKKNQIVGIDIGSHSIKVAEIEDTAKGMILKNFGTIGLPQDAILEGSIKEMEIVSAALGNLLQNLKIKNKNVALSISGYSVIVKKITIPRKEEKDLEESIQSEAEQYIPFDINDVNLDFQVLYSGEEELFSYFPYRILGHYLFPPTKFNQKIRKVFILIQYIV
ncbi:unnamed protein product, partial [marine sediment metagenome]